MNNKKGFSLISFLLYLMLFSIIALFVANIITSLLLPSLVETRKCKSIIALHIAGDLFMRDIRTMRSKVYQWKKITPHEVIWHSDECDIGWSFTENYLERKEGVYNKDWHGKKTSIIAMELDKGEFIVENHKNHVIGIEMRLTSQQAPQKIVSCYGAVNQQKGV